MTKEEEKVSRLYSYLKMKVYEKLKQEELNEGHVVAGNAGMAKIDELWAEGGV